MKMDEKDRQLYETTLVVESAKQTAELGKDVISDVVRPTSKSIGENIGLAVDGVFGWLGLWGEKQKIKQQKNLDDFKNEINGNLNKIPEENLKEPAMCVVGPAIEASKYYYEEEQFKEMFAKLIAASCDDRVTDKISPYFVEAIKQISHKEALILSKFNGRLSLPIANYTLTLKNQGMQTYMKYVLYFDNTYDSIDYSSALINLQRLGLISIDFHSWLTNDELYKIYENDPILLKAREEVKKITFNHKEKIKDIILEKRNH